MNKYNCSNVTTRTTKNCSFGEASNHSGFDDFTLNFDLWDLYLKPKPQEWFLIGLYLVIFVVSLTGNTLIVTYILRKKTLQTTLNFFLLNLALSDILVTLICLPPTLMVDFFETWLLGSILCKVTPYLQMTVICVSAFSLSAIALNRWFVVCHPLKALEIKYSRRIAVIGMTLIWGFSLGTLFPLVLVMQLDQAFENYPELELLKNCSESWSSFTAQVTFHLFYIIFCYTFPLVVLLCTYTKVFVELREAKIPGESNRCSLTGRNCVCKSPKTTKRFIGLPFSSCSDKRSSKIYERDGDVKSNSTYWKAKPVWKYKQRALLQVAVAAPSEHGELMNDGKKDQLFKVTEHVLRRRDDSANLTKQNFSSRSTSKTASTPGCSTCCRHASVVRSRRRCALMQVFLIVVFAVCYAPTMVLDLMRNVLNSFAVTERETIRFTFAIAHFFLYLNSALNPLIYNFFSEKFYNEFKKTFRCFYKPHLRLATNTSTIIFIKSDTSRSHAALHDGGKEFSQHVELV